MFWAVGRLCATAALCLLLAAGALAEADFYKILGVSKSASGQEIRKVSWPALMTDGSVAVPSLSLSPTKPSRAPCGGTN